jgi:hypothetical protein
MMKKLEINENYTFKDIPLATERKTKTEYLCF